MSAPAATAQPPVLPPTWSERTDFPGWLPPMLVKELRQGLRTRGFVGSLIVYQVIMAIALIWAMEIDNATLSRNAFQGLNAWYWASLGIVLLGITPWRGLGALRDEIDHRSIDLLVLTRLSAWRIVAGKWLSLSAQAGLLLLGTLPYGVMRYFFGSVDLLDDLGTLALMLFGSAILSALALWISSLPKLFRALLPIGVFFVLQGGGIGRLLGRALSGRGMGLPAVAATPVYEYVLMGLGGVVLIFFFLGLTVQKLAPPAENHSRTLRLAALGVVALAAILANGPGAEIELVFAFIVLLIVLASELSQDRMPLNVHWAGWMRRARPVAWALLPGWPSAAWFALLIVVGLITGVAMVKSTMPSGRALWLALLGWQMLVFPALLISFLPRRSAVRFGQAGYFIVQGLIGIISIMLAAGTSGIFGAGRLVRALHWFTQIMPGPSFWVAVPNVDKTPFAVDIVSGQVVALAVILALLARQTRDYRAEVALQSIPDPPPTKQP